MTTERNPLATTTRALPALLVSLLLAACTTVQPYVMPPESEVAWPYWPVSMRVHPLTRFVEDPDQGTMWLEARIEFRDRDDDITKCYGLLTLALTEVLPNGDAGEELLYWEVDLRDLETNRTQFDVVTRTYLCRLVVRPEKLTPRMALHAWYVSADGHRFDALSYPLSR